MLFHECAIDKPQSKTMGETEGNSQAGFGAVGIVAILLVIMAVLAGVGYIVFKKSGNTQSTSTPPATSTSATPPVTTPASEPSAREQHILVIKEWGISMPLQDTVSDAYYKMDGNGRADDGIDNTAWIGLKSLDGTSCDISKTGGPSQGINPIGLMGRALPDDREPIIGTKYTDLYPGGSMINGHYYFYEPSVIQKCVSSDTLAPISKALTTASGHARVSGSAKP